MSQESLRVFEIRSTDAINQLQTCLEEMADFPRTLATEERWKLDVFSVDLTSPILALLIQILNQPTSTYNAPTTSTTFKWDHVGFYRCKFAQPMKNPDFPNDDDDRCSKDNIHLFASALARQTSSLTLSECPEILGCLFDVPALEMKKVAFHQARMSECECAGFSDLIQKSLRLKELYIKAAHLDNPHSLAKGLANAVQLRTISIKGMTTTMPVHQQPEQTLSTALFGNSGIMERLLTASPSRQLRELYLQSMHLEDYHFMTIVELLPRSHLEVLDVLDNKIKCPGIMAFAKQLPNIKNLKQVQLRLNPWDYARDTSGKNDYEQCCAALLEGMLDNYSIQCMPLMQITVLERQLEHCSYINWVKGQILASSNAIPVGLWPLLLERVGTHNRHFLWVEESRFRTHTANALYLVLQNSPILSSICSTSSKTCSTTFLVR